MNSLKISSCIYCGEKNLYKVSATQYKCKKCLKKFSHKKLSLEFDIITLFCKNYTVKECSEALGVNYRTIQDRYSDFRSLIITFLEERYAKHYSEFSEYDEYYYLPKQKRGKVKYLFEAIGVLGMMYEDKIYTLMLPDQFSHLQKDNLSKEMNIAYMKEYAKYLNRYKIVHYQKFDSLLVQFWVYLEEFLKKYKGISQKNFIYYLKECEFKFNFKTNAKELLWDLWIGSFK